MGTGMGARDDWPPFNWTIPMAEPGYYTLRLQAIDALDVTTESAPVQLTVRPANDNLADAQVIEGHALTIETSNAAGTLERYQAWPWDPPTGEPWFYSNQGGHSIWYRWTAPEEGVCVISGAGQDGFLLSIGVYTGVVVSDLQLVAFPAGGPIAFQASEGITYHIAIDGFNGREGPLTWSLSLRPKNDSLASATPIVGIHHETLASHRGATLDPSDELLTGEADAVSLWWSWQAPQAGPVTLLATSETEELRLLVFVAATGETDLEEVAGIGTAWSQAPVARFMAIKGAQYRFVVLGRPGATADFRLALFQDVLSWLSPSDGSVFAFPATIGMAVRVPDGFPAVTRIRFLANGALVGETQAASETFSWTVLQPGSFTVEAEAVFADGLIQRTTPATLRVYAGDDLPRPRIFAGPTSDCSYVTTAVGATPFP
jgi:hypothetical protein